MYHFSFRFCHLSEELKKNTCVFAEVCFDLVLDPCSDIFS